LVDSVLRFTPPLRAVEGTAYAYDFGFVLIPSIAIMSLPKSVIENMMAHADDNEKPNLIASIVTCLVFPYAAVALRIVARKSMHVSILLDDWLILGALVRNVTP
jgi:uncharacterized membrane protein